MTDPAPITSTLPPTERLDAIIATPDAQLAANAAAVSRELLEIGEVTLERSLEAHGAEPTQKMSEGFRLLALHRQGARGDSTFNACRETCRELVYQYNVIALEPDHPDVARRVRLGAMVARHLVLFVEGKLEVAGLGEFCCSSRPLRTHDAVSGAPFQE
ncbi:MAG TPA: hypothetical protein VGU20_16000 [Stellaceae bacterium]|nr:hypothetical protein [Stellaceae bacterium]